MKQFQKKLQAQLLLMCATGMLFRVKVTGREVWDAYLNAFSKEDDPVFRDPESTVHNCNQCKNFIRRYGNIVALDDKFNIISLFSFPMEGEYENITKVLSALISDSQIEDVFFETLNELVSLPYEKCKASNDIFRLGIDKNVKRYTKEEAELYGVVKANQIKTFDHMHVDIPSAFVDDTGKSVEAITGEYRDKYSVFKRAMEEIPLDTYELVKDLISQGSLLDGETHVEILNSVSSFRVLHLDCTENTDNWFWMATYNMTERVAKFKNTLIGVLCTELAEGEEINKACQSWNKRVDPANYMKAVAPITQRQIKEAEDFVVTNGYVESFDRRFATIDDIKVTEILHSNVGDGAIKDVSIFDDIKSTKSQHKRNQFDNVEEVSIEKFMTEILPGCTSVEAFLTNQHIGNMVTLTTANQPESKPIFKWPNNYSWTFNGNLAGKSQIKETVKSVGGDVEGILRFSIMWAEKDGDNSDLDAWCQTPNGTRIGFTSKRDHNTGGSLDIDIITPSEQMPEGAVENITFPNVVTMDDGVYKFWINQYSARQSKGFKAEIEFNGELYSYEQTTPVRGNAHIAEVTLKGEEFSINHVAKESFSSKEVYGIETNHFHKVNLMCLSPNHWGQNNIGNKHYFFMLDGCKTPVSIRSFHNENLNTDLVQYRKVMEVLGATQKILYSDTPQLSGLGFNATVRDEVVLKLSGNFKRVLKVTF